LDVISGINEPQQQLPAAKSVISAWVWKSEELIGPDTEKSAAFLQRARQNDITTLILRAQPICRNSTHFSYRPMPQACVHRVRRAQAEDFLRIFSKAFLLMHGALLTRTARRVDQQAEWPCAWLSAAALR
jgi:hypothetical protein